ncbi:c-type cytochrome [Sunxiuqinia sp. A32]|uniref:c-type cytochrome n=1 Tax=Sunxiuqinia sp. A32 TaxID=3461496 RepID=UPI0040460135
MLDFPIFHLDFMGNRMLIAVIAILHVIINHALAVGFIPLVTWIEYRGFLKKERNPEAAKAWDEQARRLMFIGFIITTSVGALTGVGIWFAASLANPASIGSLIRVFYFAWFTEWIVFMLEVVFIMIYFLNWKKSNQSVEAKKKHIRFGAMLAIFSWLTMAIIVAILGFMMDPGNWLTNHTLWSGFTNPIYLPQLIFRTPVAMMMAGCFALMATLYGMKKSNPYRPDIVRTISFWILRWTPIAAIGAFIYYWQIPRFMIGNLPVAIGTQAFQEWYSSLLHVMLIAIIIGFVVGISGVFIPKRLPKHLMIIPFIVAMLFLGTFERLREFIRKPYVIGEYMYANGLLVEEYPLYQQTGILNNSAYSAIKTINSSNRLHAGEEVFKIACTRCHTTHGINSIVTNFENMYGADQEFNHEAMKAYISSMHNVRSYMPPFPGNDQELGALVDYIIWQRKEPTVLEGTQLKGIEVN